MKRNKNKPGKKRGLKSWLSIGAVVLVSVITLGIVAALISPVAAFGSSGSGGSNSGNSTGSVSRPNIEDAPIVSHRLFNEMYFDEAYTVTAASENKYIPGLKISEAMKYGTLDTTQSYLKYSTSPEDAGKVLNSEFSIYFSGYSTPDNEVAIPSSAMDYLVIDFDVWTESELFPEMYIYFDEEAELALSFGIFNYFDDGVFVSCEVFDNQYDSNGEVTGTIRDKMSQQVYDPSVPFHITFLIVFNQEANEYITNYYDGNYYTFYVNPYVNLEEILDFRISFPECTLTENYSVCLDNIQFCAYGVGDGSYDGDISKLLENVSDVTNKTQLDIKNCRDWVLYGKYE